MNQESENVKPQTEKPAPVNDISAQEMLDVIENALGLTIKYDVLSQRLVVETEDNEHRIFDDGDMTRIYNHCREHAPTLVFKAYKSIHAIDCAVNSVRTTRPFHPLKDYLNRCRDKYLDNQRDYLGEFVSRMTLGDEMQEALLRRWLHGVIGCVFFQYQNDMLILRGKQGIGKSSFFQYLTRNCPDYYIDDEVNLYDKDQVLYLGTKMIWVIEEFGTILKTADRNKVKAFLTKYQIEKRQAYARYASKFNRICSHAGTTNDMELFTDLTGNRRYLLVDLVGIELDYVRENLNPDLIWGQVVDNVLSEGVKVCRLTPDEIAYKNDANEQNVVTDPIMETMREWFSVDPKGKLKSRDIKEKLDKQNLGNVSWYKIVDIMAALGAEKKMLREGENLFKGYSGLSWRPEHSPAGTSLTSVGSDIRYFKRT